jgi:hypothetical protein
LTVRTIVGVSALLCASACGLITTLAHYQMMDEVNDKLPDQERFDPIGWYWLKSQRLRREYKRLCPHGGLVTRIRLIFGIMIACLLVSIWAFEF